MAHAPFRIAFISAVLSFAIGLIGGWIAASHVAASRGTTGDVVNEYQYAIDTSFSESPNSEHSDEAIQEAGNRSSSLDVIRDGDSDRNETFDAETAPMSEDAQPEYSKEQAGNYDDSAHARRQRAAVAERLASEALLDDVKNLLDDGDWEARHQLSRLVSIVGGLDQAGVKDRIGAALSADNASQRAVALYVAAKFAPGSYETQLEIAAIKGDVDERIAVASGLGAEKSREGALLLKQLLKDSDPAVERQAIQSIGKIGIEKSVPQLISRIQSDDLQIAVLAAESLRSMGREREAAQVVPRIAPTLRDPDSEKRLQAIRMLMRLGVEESLPYLRDAADDPRASVRNAARRAINEIESSQ